MENYGKQKKKQDKASSRKPDLSPGVGYVWGRYQHPHDARPKTIPLIKQVV